jgi:nucleoside-diphosphate-sugar epimerase
MRGDPTKLNEETGWRPLVALDTTLTDVLDYWRSGAKRPV